MLKVYCITNLERFSTLFCHCLSFCVLSFEQLLLSACLLLKVMVCLLVWLKWRWLSVLVLSGHGRPACLICRIHSGWTSDVRWWNSRSLQNGPHVNKKLRSMPIEPDVSVNLVFLLAEEETVILAVYINCCIVLFISFSLMVISSWKNILVYCRLVIKNFFESLISTVTVVEVS